MLAFADRVPVIVLVADGARPDAFDGATWTRCPRSPRLRDEGALHRVRPCSRRSRDRRTRRSCIGRFPGPIGIPGLRWYDRARDGMRLARLRAQLRRPPDAPLRRRISTRERADDLRARAEQPRRAERGDARAASRAARSARRRRARRCARRVTHFRGRAERWLDVDRETADVDRATDARRAPATSCSPRSSAWTRRRTRAARRPAVHEAMRIVDDAAARLRADAERGGWWDDTHLWIVSDHGHSPVHTHEDLAGVVAADGLRTVAHPWSATIAPDAAVMVSGNAMAHVYLDLGDASARGGPRSRRGMSGSRMRCSRARRSTCCSCRTRPRGARCGARARGIAVVERSARRSATGARAAIRWDSAATSRDAPTRRSTRRARATIPTRSCRSSRCAGSPRAGDVILSAAPGWDFRARYEPIPHRELARRAAPRPHDGAAADESPAAGTPRRTTDSSRARSTRWGSRRRRCSTAARSCGPATGLAEAPRDPYRGSR